MEEALHRVVNGKGRCLPPVGDLQYDLQKYPLPSSALLLPVRPHLTFYNLLKRFHQLATQHPAHEPMEDIS